MCGIEKRGGGWGNILDDCLGLVDDCVAYCGSLHGGLHGDTSLHGHTGLHRHSCLHGHTTSLDGYHTSLDGDAMLMLVERHVVEGLCGKLAC